MQPAKFCDVTEENATQAKEDGSVLQVEVGKSHCFLFCLISSMF